MTHLIQRLDALVWSLPLLILLTFVGLYLTIVTRGVQFRRFFYAHKLAFSRSDDTAAGDISQFEAFMTALAGTIGIGSIAGVATAITLGGVGALVWMWVAALIGMATKYGEAILAIVYRKVDEEGSMSGGPMYYIERGLGLKWLAMLFALFGICASFGIGNVVQSHAIAEALTTVWETSPLVTGLFLAVGIGAALIGGIRSIGRIVSYLVPAMALFYLGIGAIAITRNLAAVPAAFTLIFEAAIKGQAAVGGFTGAGVMLAIQAGISRGIFSSEAGLGSSPIAAAAAKTDIPARQALISMCSVFLTTGVVCTITGLVIAISGVQGLPLDSSALALTAFDRLFPSGGLLVTLTLIPFGYSTILSWAYYGERCVEYLLGIRWVRPFRILFTLVVVVGALLPMAFVWSFSNAMNGLMAYPNLIALFFLGGVIRRETKRL